MILSCHNLTKAFGEELLFSGCSFHIEDREKAAIIGANGCGKTTLMRMLLGLEDADEGQSTISKDKTFGYLSQHQEDMDGNRSVYEELLTAKADVIQMEETLREMEAKMHTMQDETELKTLMDRYETLSHSFDLANGYAYQSEVLGVLNGLGFLEEDHEKSVSALSGGQKTRLALGKILLTAPDILFLDEPTNHLDMDSIRFLENFLINYKGAVVLISHDRYFLDKIVTKIIEIDNRKATVFSGSYSDYAAKKQQLMESAMHAYLNQQREIKHQEEVIAKLKSFNREKSIKRAESREKALAKVEVLEKPAGDAPQMHFTLTPSRISGNDVLLVSELEKCYDSHRLFTDLSIDIKRGEHVALIGKNGTGKTTILKIINGLVNPEHGMIRLGTNVEIGYYDQEHHVLHMEKTVFDEISDDYPDLTGTQIRNTLAAFLFTGDDVFKKIENLSGGERGRVSLAKLMLSTANFLILDEPTNHLDIASREILEQALNRYEGTVLYVSHDRYFINRTAHRILDLENETLLSYLGNYDYYLEKHDGENARMQPIGGLQAVSSPAPSAPQPAEPETVSENKQNWQAQKEAQAKRRKLENGLKKAEEEIEKLETALSELDATMAKPEIATDIGKLSTYSKEAEEKRARLESLYEEWEDLSGQLEEME
ncbi:MAG: ABC-F family ATP-binding cassette domain-containing protein [Lachnospiraceae bacterium]|nr:ABC-F family ATP-binding cassette domain-containing protein [Lachnospiraceae bacterium]